MQLQALATPHPEPTRRRIEKQIAEATKGLELQKVVAEEKLSEMERLAEQLSTLETEHTKVRQELEDLGSLQTQLDVGRARVTELRSEAAALEVHSKQLRLDMAGIQEKIKLLHEPTAACPLCGQDLTQDDHLRLLTELQEEGIHKGNTHRSNTSALKENSSRIAALESKARHIERTLRRLPALQGREATLGQDVEQAQAAASRLPEQRTVLTTLEQQLQSGGFAAKEQTELTELEQLIKDLGYDQAAHDTIRQTVTSLAHFENDRGAIEKAQEIIAELRKNQDQLLKAHQQWTTSLQADRHHHKELVAALARFEELAKELETAHFKVSGLRSKRGHAGQMVGAAQQKLDHCRYLAGERNKRAKQLKEVSEERGVYRELQHAFGKRGVQALIIETAIPEIEDEANVLLGRMTEGRMSMHFETQRDTKSGGTIETLDIKISDENGPRSYELYSGGEAFRINFAIRIALSKLLARRAGAQLQTLIIDEGFGTQDAHGRQSLVEAINSIRDDFARIIVVTHVEEMRDAFPVRIDVYKTPQGSQLTIN